MALCDGSVPVGKYSREAFVSLGYLPDTDDNSAYTSPEISEALGGIEINECADVSVAAQAVAEGSNEIGTIYYSDYYDFQDDLNIIAQDNGTLTGPIVYPRLPDRQPPRPTKPNWQRRKISWPSCRPRKWQRSLKATASSSAWNDRDPPLNLTFTHRRRPSAAFLRRKVCP